ncbi:FAD:protein FMN transferase [Haloplanus aerogenes]|uniref:FAD:protein FMN transferase n=1 Tax=Haloplanus aerogenes TaxID=660522 RepID=A0A3M0DPP2_9EURY|nr:FAD:protein FMN transferase [Haloplanus aerogenes]AZH24622.1 FAD:protein FMN transferase [Haloplanus aerogenes]RMB23722.1 thiamine biosynthesis lipoprotein [Haloplanus aerogenes]
MISSAYERLGDARREFRCCDTAFVVRATGVRADTAACRARRTAETLEAQLNAFDDASAVARLNRTGEVTNEHVARLVRRGHEYRDRTDGVFDIRQGRTEHALKEFLRGETDAPPGAFEAGEVRTDGDRVTADAAVDLNGLAKGYIVDRAAASLAGPGRRGFVSGGGDMSPPTGPIAVESPYGDETPLKVLDTDWNVATSGGYRRTRAGVDHVYDPTAERFGARHESVTVVARRDCTEADALATTLAALPLDDVLALAEDWGGLEALLVHGGVFHTTTGFDAHVRN